MKTTQIKSDAETQVRALGLALRLPGEFKGAAPYGSGHINDTYAAVYDQAGIRVRYLHQRINHRVFADPVRLMDNILRVTAHQASKARGPKGDLSRRALTVLEYSGSPVLRDAQGQYWRSYLFIEKARTFDVIQDPGQAFQAARAFGSFQDQLRDLPGPGLHETIPGFHDSPRRFENFEMAAALVPQGRLAGAGPEVDFAMSQKSRMSELARAGCPQRVVHNDAKLNNVMIDDSSGEGLCVIDLDTVMPGLAAYDFGDLVRSGTMPVAEDELDLSKVRMQWPVFEGLARGFLEGADFLTRMERQSLALGSWLMTFEVGLRFLTDHLEGDRYFKVHRPAQNLDRARVQFALAQDIDAHLNQMENFIKNI